MNSEESTLRRAKPALRANPYYRLVADYARLAQAGRRWPLGGFPNCPRPRLAPDAPKVLIFSPHPDDEVITGGLPLRLLREARWKVINVAVTLGSKRERRAERLAELEACCECIGFGLEQTAPSALEKVTPDTRERARTHWSKSVKVIASILAQHQPRVVFLPHKHDWHPAHIGTHWLVLDALTRQPAGFTCYTVETEFWGAMAAPNLMVEVSPRDLGDLIKALSCHAGELKRNPYHLTLPAWMADNVRRGTELVCGPGSASPEFAFATLYRVGRWVRGKLRSVLKRGQILGAGKNPADLFRM